MSVPCPHSRGSGRRRAWGTGTTEGRNGTVPEILIRSSLKDHEGGKGVNGVITDIQSTLVCFYRHSRRVTSVRRELYCAPARSRRQQLCMGAAQHTALAIKCTSALPIYPVPRSSPIDCTAQPLPPLSTPFEIRHTQHPPPTPHGAMAMWRS